MPKKQREQAPAGRGQAWLKICLWLAFATGLMLQAMAPQLKIENHAFVMPETVNVRGSGVRPDALVRRERWTQGASGLLAVGSAIALAFCYRRTVMLAIRG